VSVGQNSRLSEASAPRAISTAASTDRSSRASQRGTQPISNQTSPTPS
jgi:hypothetical protein